MRSAVSRWSALVAVQVALTLLLLEAMGRLFDPLGISYYPETARYLDTLIQEDPIGYRNRPGLNGTFYGAPVSINSHGMRDREVSSKAPGEYRVLVMGDSVPFGIGVRYEDSIPYQLERILNETAEPGRSYRTLNMGVPSYNTEQELTQLRESGLSLNPDLAMLLFSRNDIEPKKWVFAKRSAWYADLAQRSYAATLLFVFARELRARVGQPAQLISMDEYRPDSSRWQAIDRSLTEINRQLTAAGVPFVVFTRFFGAVTKASELLNEVAAREGFPIVDLDPWSDPRWKNQDPLKYCNSVVDNHPNAAGSRVYAVVLAESLHRTGMLNPAGATGPHAFN